MTAFLIVTVVIYQDIKFVYFSDSLPSAESIDLGMPFP
jgi:hypothetical protein